MKAIWKTVWPCLVLIAMIGGLTTAILWRLSER